MESPSSRTPLHNEISKAYWYGGAPAIVKVLQDHNVQVNSEQVQEVIDKWQKTADLGYAGISVESAIINSLVK